MMQPLFIEAPCKINLLLDIVGIAPNGYHLLETIMQSVDLWDEVILQPTGTNRIEVACSGDLPQQEQNIAYRVAQAFFRASGLPEQGIAITIDKRIPAEAGLGGGSTDAAAVLLGLRELFAPELTEEILRQAAATVGADVPFCCMGGCALAEGIGERLTPLPLLPDCHILLVKPPNGNSTQGTYQAYDACTKPKPLCDVRGMEQALRAGDLFGVGSRMANVFELVAGPETARIKGLLLAHGAIGACLSGSGSTVAGIFTDKEAARSAGEAASAENPDVQVFLTAPIAGIRFRR